MRISISKDQAEILYTTYYLHLYRLALLMLKSPSMAEDVVSETFLKAFEKYHLFDSTRAFKPWISKILINEVRQALRKSKRLILSNDIELENHMESARQKNSNDSLCQNFIEMEKNSAIWQLVENLRPKARQIVVLHYYESFSVQEISMILNIPLGTCKSRLNGAMKQLRNGTPGLLDYFDAQRGGSDGF